MMVALLGGLQTIPGELYEAAAIDGAIAVAALPATSRCPACGPVSSTVILLGTIWTFNMFPIIFLVTGGEPAGQTEILVTGAFRAAFEGIRNYSLASTYGVLILSILLVFAGALPPGAAQAGRGVLMTGTDASILPSRIGRTSRAAPSARRRAAQPARLGGAARAR